MTEEPQAKSKYGIILITLWLIWGVAAFLTGLRAWRSYTTTNPEAMIYSGATIKVCPDFGGFSPCAFWQFLFIPPHPVTLALLVLGAVLLILTLTRLIWLVINR